MDPIESQFPPAQAVHLRDHRAHLRMFPMSDRIVREGLYMLVTFEQRPREKIRMSSKEVTANKIKSTYGTGFLDSHYISVGKFYDRHNKCFIP